MSNFLIACLVFSMVMLMSAHIDQNADASPGFIISKIHCFQPAGKLNYMYDRGIFVPLKDGQILCLDGYNAASNGTSAQDVQALDGKRYGPGTGMVELYDPITQKSHVVTRLPFRLFSFGGLSQSEKGTSAIELHDGRILIVGKFEENLPNPQWKSDEFGLVYDWHANTCQVIKAPPDVKRRDLATLHLLADGRVLILGGEIGGVLDIAWKTNPDARVLAFDPATNQISVVGELRHARYGHATVPISATEFMLFGGWGPSKEEAKERYCYMYNTDGSCHDWHERERTREVEVFDLKTGRSHLVGHTLSDRSNFSALALPDGKVFIHGGPLKLGSNLRYSASELFDPTIAKSRYVGEPRIPDNVDLDKAPYFLPGEAVDSELALLGPDLILVGDLWVHIYDYRALTDEEALKNHQACKLLAPRRNHHVVKTSNSRVFVMGGSSATHIEEFVYQTRVGSKGEKHVWNLWHVRSFGF